MALQAITVEQDGGKKLPLQDFLAEILSRPGAVAYGNWQVSQYYQGAGDLQKPRFWDLALAGRAHNLDILVSQPTSRSR